MGGRIPEETIDQILHQVDIVEVVGRYVQLKKQGRYYFGLCPFHAEKSPSFSVTPDRQIFHCFGCGTGGTVIRFLMEMEQLTFREAVLKLAESVGVEISTKFSSSPSLDENKRVFYQLMELASRWFHRAFLTSQQGAVAREYMRSKQIDGETIAEFRVGYAPPAEKFLISFLKNKGYTLKQITNAGLCRWPRSRDGCLLLPVCDSQGRVIGFSVKRLAEQTSFLTPFLREQNGYYLYHFHRARASIRKQKKAVVFPDVFDVLAAWQAGVRIGVASLQPVLTQAHAKILERNADTVILFGGAEQSERAIELFANRSCTLKLASSPSGMSLERWIVTRGEGALQQILAQAQSVTSYRLDVLRQRMSLDQPDQQAAYVQQAFQYIADLQSPIERDHYLHRLAEQTSLPLSDLKQRFQQFRGGKRDKDKSTWNNGYRAVDKHVVGNDSSVSTSPFAEQRLFAAMLSDRSVAQWVREKIDAHFLSASYQQLAAQLYAYYDEGYPADIKKFLSYLTDPALIAEVEQLVEKGWPQPSPQELDDYVRSLQKIPLQQAIAEKEQVMKRYSEAGEPLKAAQLLMEINELRKKINKR